MKLGSPQADAAYDRWHDRMADAYFEPQPICPWCGCATGSEEGECDECGCPMEAEEYWECPYCGERREDAFAHCGESDAHCVRYSLIDGCPKCHSTDIGTRHAEATFAYPETDYKVCETCGHQFDHQ